MSAEDGMPTNDLSDIIITPEQPEVKDGRGVVFKNEGQVK